MTKTVYVASSEAHTGKALVALGLIDALNAAGMSAAVYRPLQKAESDGIGELLLLAADRQQVPSSAAGVSYEVAHADLTEALTTIVTKHAALDGTTDVIVAVGSDWTDIDHSTELEVNARVAANLNAPVILAVSGRGRTPAEVRWAAESALGVFKAEHNSILAIVATRVKPSDDDAVQQALAGLAPVVASVPEDAVVSAPTVRSQFEAAGCEIINGSEARLDAESLETVIAAMTLPNVRARLKPESTVIVASDRSDLLPEVLTGGPKLAGLILVGGYELPADFMDAAHQIDPTLPIATTPESSFVTALAAGRQFGSLSVKNPRKAQAARELFAKHVDAKALVTAVVETESKLRTPLAFEYQLQAMARANLKRIVLPESSDDRILESAAIVAERGFAHVILLGEADDIRARAAEQGWNLDGVEIISPQDPVLLEKFASEYARLRAHKGVTIEQARETLTDLSYFATMMVHFGMADGMVSGAVNTTANTIKPSFEFIKTKPGIKVVSSSFLMCMPERVLVFGDCAVNPNPTPEELADIAISSAETAMRFGIEPRVAMLSYSTGASGKGADVDAVAEATRIAKERAPQLKLDGPIQFDAAIDMAVGSKKLPGSAVAGQATVFIFPDLNTGNNTYKAVQRSSGALAVGPVLQGLNKPVNDLSRGALVGDIVNTVAITAIQAQDDANKENQ